MNKEKYSLGGGNADVVCDKGKNTAVKTLRNCSNKEKCECSEKNISMVISSSK